MGKRDLLKDGMKGGLNGLLSSTNKPTTEQKPKPTAAANEFPVHCNVLINKSIHTRIKYLAIKKGVSLRDIVNEAMNEYLQRHDT